MLPKLYSSLNGCLLRVIDNDNYKEVPKVFNKVSPYTYSKNKVVLKLSISFESINFFLNYL